jgi:hypothetical protein
VNIVRHRHNNISLCVVPAKENTTLELRSHGKNEVLSAHGEM